MPGDRCNLQKMCEIARNSGFVDEGQDNADNGSFYLRFRRGNDLIWIGHCFLETLDTVVDYTRDFEEALEALAVTFHPHSITSEEKAEIEKQLQDPNLALEWCKEKIFDLVHRLPLIDWYDKDFGNNRVCECGHPYYRHFDSYDNMAPVGCKYCSCRKFKERKVEHEAQ